MKNILFVMFALVALVLATSCQKTEVYSDELTTSVIFKPMMEEDLRINKTDVNRDVLGDDFVNVAIKSMELSAEHIASGQIAGDIFNIVETGGENIISLDEVRLGMNKFRATTTSYVETAATDPVYGEADGFSSHNKVEHSRYPFTLSPDPIETTDSLVKYLRAIQPFVEFVGETNQVVTYNNCDGDICNEVELDMFAQQGRWITTVEFEDAALAEHYRAHVKVTHNNNDIGPAPIREVNLDRNAPFAWFYMTHAQCNEDLDINIRIYLREIESNTILRTWYLNTDETSANYYSELDVVNGVDRWVKIVISEDALKSGCVDFKFNWEWTTEDLDIDL